MNELKQLGLLREKAVRRAKKKGIYRDEDVFQRLRVESRKELLGRMGASISNHLKKKGVSNRAVRNDFKGWRRKRRLTHHFSKN